MSGIYLHIPFCRHACSYCNFYFSTQQSLIKDFVTSLLHEIEHRDLPNHLVNTPIKTLYFGGGTPSLLNKIQVSQIFEALNNRFDLSKIEECTFELNPENVSVEYLNAIHKLGVTRVSMGIQSFQPWILKHMHRSHTPNQASEAYEKIKESNISAYNVDLIYAYPGQNMYELEEDLKLFISLDAPHISAYNLTLEKGTRLDQLHQKNKLNLLDEETQRAHSEKVRSTLESAGYLAYEVSNYAKTGYEAMHNAAYWEHKNYFGFGPGAHSFLWDKEKKTAKRWSIPADLKAYIKDGVLPKEDEVLIPLKELGEERLMLSLRTSKGVLIKEWELMYETSISDSQWRKLKEWYNLNLLTLDPIKYKRLILSPEGRLVADHLSYQLITA